MNALGSSFVASVFQGHTPRGGSALPMNPQRVPQEYQQTLDTFAGTRGLDNTARDLDKRPGFIAIDYAENESGTLRAHRFEASFTGRPEQGILTTTRQFQLDGKTVRDVSASKVENGVISQATYIDGGNSKALHAPTMTILDSTDPSSSVFHVWGKEETASSLGLLVAK